jgi:glycosyltransferase involved in cell wall biosynthesis
MTVPDRTPGATAGSGRPSGRGVSFPDEPIARDPFGDTAAPGAGAVVTRLVLVGPLPPPYYGQSVSFRMLVDEVERLGVAYSVVNLAHGEASAKRIGVVTQHRFADYLSILRRYALAVASRPATIYITIAQSRAGFLRDCVMIWLATMFGHRLIVHLKGGNYGNFYASQPAWLRALVRTTLRRTDRILVLGERLRSMFDFDPRLADRIRVVPNGLPDDREPRLEGKALPAPGEGPVRILFLSNLVESKGWLDVLEAVRMLRDEFGERIRCDFHGLFLTNPADDARITSAEHARETFDAYVRRHALEGTVAYGGVASGEQKRTVLADAHFFVLPTQYSNEGQPVSIIEAMAHANVVLSTDFRAIPDLVAHGETGELVPYGDPAVLAGAIAALIRDPERYGRMSRAAVQRFRRRFTRRSHLDTILPHLLGEGGGVSGADRALTDGSAA